MPYVADPSEETVRTVRDRLLSFALRPGDSGLDAFYRVPRSKLHQLVAPELRKEDFYEAVRRLAGETDAVREATGTGRRADVVLDRIVDEVGEWETVLYQDFPEDTPEPEEVAALLGVTDPEPIPDGLLVRRTPRPPVVHDPDVPRTCAKCGETKPTTAFGRRSADPDLPGYQQFQSYCAACTKESKRQWAADNGDRRTQRPERWVQGKYARPGGRRPRTTSTPYRFTN